MELYEGWKDKEPIWSKIEIQLPWRCKISLMSCFLDYFTILFTRYFIVRFMYEDNVAPTWFYFLVISITLSFQIKKIQIPKIVPTWHSTSSPLSAGDNVWPHILIRGDQKKMSAWGDLKSSCHWYLPWRRGGAYYVSCQKKTFKSKIWLWGLNFKCSLVLANQPTNV